MCKKVNFSISHDVDDYLTHIKNTYGVSKSKALSLLVMQYGSNLERGFAKYQRKEDTAAVVSD